MLTLQICDEDKVKGNILKHLANVWHPVNTGLPFAYTQMEDVNCKTRGKKYYLLLKSLNCLACSKL